MNPLTFAFRVLVVLALGLLAAPAWAQTPRGPFAGLFGRQAKTGGQTLDFRGSLFGLYQNVIVPTDHAEALDPRFQKTATLGGTSGTLTYGYNRSRASGPADNSTFSVNGSGTIADYSINPNLPTYNFGLGAALSKTTRRIAWTSSVSGAYSSTYLAPLQTGVGDGGIGLAAAGAGGFITPTPQSLYAVGPDVPTYSVDAGTSLSAKLTRKLVFNASALESYSSGYTYFPYQSGQSIDVALLTAGGGFAPSRQPIIGSRGSFGITDNLTKSSSLLVQADWTESRVLNITGTGGHFNTLGARAVFTQQLARGLGFHVGYGRSVTRYSDGPATTNDSVDAGIDYNYGGSIALGPRTTVTFGSSTAFVTTADRLGEHQTHFRVNGNAGIARRIGRTWNASAAYVRTLGFLAGFTDPILSDSVNGTFGGQIATRATWSSGVTWARNQVGFNSTESFGGYSATSGLNLAIARMLGAYAQYAYFGYQVPPGTTALNILSTFSRQTVSVGLNLWLPILNGRNRS